MSLFHGSGSSWTSPGMIKKTPKRIATAPAGVADDGADTDGDDPDEHHAEGRRRAPPKTRASVIDAGGLAASMAWQMKNPSRK